VTAGKRWVVAGAAILVMVAGISLWERAGDGPSLDGPLALSGAHGGSISLAVGDKITDGDEMLRVTGDEAAVIDAVWMEGDSGLRLIDAMVVGPERRESYGVVRRWPLHRVFGAIPQPAVGATIAPIPGEAPLAYELLLGIEVIEPGYLIRDAVVIDYHVGDRHYRWRQVAQLVVCTDRSMLVDGLCPPPDDGAE